jgi:predicted metal-dependent phosphoesterase TrpH
MAKYFAEHVAPYDFHLHTCWSYDATAPVESYFCRARELGTRCIAITEHHQMDSLPEVLEIARRYPEIRIVAAAELSVHTTIGGVDLLCYGLPTVPDKRLTTLLDEYHQWQRDAGAAISAGLQALGYDFTDERRLALLRTCRPERVIARQGATHVKSGLLHQHLVAQGYAAGLEECGKLLAAARERVAGPPYPAVERVVQTVHEVGGLIAIAHPQAYFNGADRQRMDMLREQCALDGIECAHPAVDPALTPMYEAYCREHDLFSVGGSDCHNEESVPQMFARHGGKAEWLEHFLARLEG